MPLITNIILAFSIFIIFKTVYPVIHLSTISKGFSLLSFNQGILHNTPGPQRITHRPIRTPPKCYDNEAIYNIREQILPHAVKTKIQPISTIQKEQPIKVTKPNVLTTEIVKREFLRFSLPKVDAKIRPLEVHGAATKHLNFKPKPGPPLDYWTKFVCTWLIGFAIFYALFAFLWIVIELDRMEKAKVSEPLDEIVITVKKKKKKRKKQKKKHESKVLPPVETELVQQTEPSQKVDKTTSTNQDEKAHKPSHGAVINDASSDLNKMNECESDEKWQIVARHGNVRNIKKKDKMEKNKEKVAMKEKKVNVNQKGITEKKNTTWKKLAGKQQKCKLKNNNKRWENTTTKQQTINKKTRPEKKKYGKNTKKAKNSTSKIPLKQNSTKPKTSGRILPEAPWESPWKRVDNSVRILDESDFPKLM